LSEQPTSPASEQASARSLRAPPAQPRRLKGAEGKDLLQVPRVRAFLVDLVEGTPFKEAAEKARITLWRARKTFADPVVRRAYLREIEVLREGERARNIHLALGLRDRGFTPGCSAAESKVALEAARYLDGNEGKPGVTVNVGVRIGPGLIVDLSDDPEREAGTIEGKVLSAHTNSR
jgi:hypothetical protein